MIFNTKKFKYALAAFAFTSFITLSATSVNAETKEYRINNLQTLQSEIVKLNAIPSGNSEQESDDKIQYREEILKNTNPKVLDEYVSNLTNDLKNVELEASFEDTVSSSLDSEDVPKVYSDSVHLSNSQADVEIVAVDAPVENNIISSPVLAATSNSTVKNGTHNYKVLKSVYHTLFPDTKLYLTTTYTASKSGLRAEGASTAGTYALLPVTVSKSAHITDSVAKSVGANINAQGDYTVTYAGYNGVGIFSYDYTITSYIKWVKKGSTKQTVETKFKVNG